MRSLFIRQSNPQPRGDATDHTATRLFALDICAPQCHRALRDDATCLHFPKARFQSRNWIGRRSLKNLLHCLNELCARIPSAPRFWRTNLVVDSCGGTLADSIAQRIGYCRARFPIVRRHLGVPWHRLSGHIQRRLAIVQHTIREKPRNIPPAASILRHRLKRKTLTRRRDHWNHRAIPRTPLPADIVEPLSLRIHLIERVHRGAGSGDLLLRVGED